MMNEQARPDYNADMERQLTATRMAEAVAADYKRDLDAMRTATTKIVREVTRLRAELAELRECKSTETT